MWRISIFGGAFLSKGGQEGGMGGGWGSSRNSAAKGRSGTGTGFDLEGGRRDGRAGDGGDGTGVRGLS